MVSYTTYEKRNAFVPSLLLLFSRKRMCLKSGRTFKRPFVSFAPLYLALFADTLSDVIFYIFQSDGAMNTLTQEEKESIWYG